MKKIIVGIMLFLTIFLPSMVNAETLQDKYDQLASLQAQYNTNKNNKNLTEAQIATLNSEINTISASIEQIRKDIVQAEADIETSKDKINDKKIETDGLIQFLQVSNGGNIYLEYLFDAENYTDFIYRYEVVKQLTNYNSDLISELESLILELKEKEKQLSDKKVKLENERTELTSKVNTLTYSLASFRSEGASLAEDISDLKEEIDAYVKMGCLKTQEISTCSASINATGWKYPMDKGCVTSEYVGFGERLDYNKGSGHHAIDLDCVGEGAKVYAAASGQIARIVREGECGGNMVYIYHTVNGKKYTTVYMHLLSIASGIVKDKIVTDNTVIGYMGGWSTSTANGGYDGCTTGAHLHFGIAEGWNAASFNSYSFNPREIFAFPKLVYNGGGYFYR